jgi:uncharacterized protein YjiS (DUF1127 family)
MSTMNPIWSQVANRFIPRYRSNLRVELRDISDSLLRDIGLSLGSERIGSAMRFWIP